MKTEPRVEFSPRAFLKAQRPERFSDSEPISVPSLDRSILEYHLGTLTNRSQEADFARFAMRLAECEVCPNILPQTGPTGGGDSKADAETYPVADGLSLAWYSGIGREASCERWAFAFSAMKEWRPKVRSDIAKIAITGRGYTKAFFITNQFVSDKARADVEDKLRTKHNLDVRIFDRSWILDRVFSGRHEQLAIDELRLTTSVRHEVRKGPLDVQREIDLNSIEDRIQAAARSDNYTFATIDDCLTAAELARDLDRPRTEVDGRHQRAERLAKQYGTHHQQLECAYSKAWTAFWWYEDLDTFIDNYVDVERLTKGSKNAYQLELLHNLWMLLHSANQQCGLKENQTKLTERTSTLTRELDRLSSEANRPSTALQARAIKLLVRLLISKPLQRDPILRELTAVIGQSKGLVGFPLEKLSETLLRLGEYLGTQPAYSELFEKITEEMALRIGEIAAARMLSKRGFQELKAKRPYEAIRLLGRSLARLHKHESRHDAVRSLLLCGNAYEQAGLLWAARGSALAAAALATGDYWTYSEVTNLQVDSYGYLKWLELRLGRLPQAMAWHEVHQVVTRLLTERGEEVDKVNDEQLQFDAMLGILFLRADLTALSGLSSIPDVLREIGFYFASVALLYALGHEDLLPDDLSSDTTENSDLETYFSLWRDQPAADDLPNTVVLYDQTTVELVSVVLGCRVVVESDNASPSIELSETVIAALESFVATGHYERMLGQEPEITLRIKKSDSAIELISFAHKERNGRTHFDVICQSFKPHDLKQDDLENIRSRLMDLLAEVTARAFFIDDVERVFGKLVKEESAFERSLNFTGSFGTVSNVLGKNPKMNLAAWTKRDTRQYPLKRVVVWDAAERFTKSTSHAVSDKPEANARGSSSTESMLNRENVRHNEMRTVSLIREPLWNRAGWIGTVFASGPIGTEPPIMALLFSDSDHGSQIFRHLYTDIGQKDEQDILRISIIRGIDMKNPHYYRIIVGSNPNSVDSQSTKMLLLMSRVQTMTPNNSVNLNRFLDNYNRAKKYYFTFSSPPSAYSPGRIVTEHMILKSQLHVLDAWNVNKYCLESAGIQPDDQPIIPTGQNNAPVLELLHLKRSQK